jgi:bacillithiol synthase
MKVFQSLVTIQKKILTWLEKGEGQMQIKPISLKGKSKLMEQYFQESKRVLKFFHYNPFHQNTYQKRYKELMNRSFQRDSLIEALLASNKNWNASAKTLGNIERLRDDKSVAVVGGQQAGLLTGPLYTIHKIISILQLAKDQENKLGVPVIPVFWIAGEDHDFQEINHVYIPNETKMKKVSISQKQRKKESVSMVEMDTQAIQNWVDQLFTTLKETEWTKNCYSKIKDIIDESKSFVDFFAKLIFLLFQDSGLVLLNSADPSIRQLESTYFVRLIETRESLAHEVESTLNNLWNEGFPISLDANRDDGHLFYHLNGERILLKVNELGNWTGKNGECEFSTEELIGIAMQKPQVLSNNVVTRPIMQDFLLPVLAFIGGPGEIAYWSALKGAFETLHMQMPPVLPRLSFTLVDKRTEKFLRQLGLHAEEVISNGVLSRKSNWLKKQLNPPIEELVENLKHEIEKAHSPLREIANDMKPDLGEVAEKNLLLLFKEIDYLKGRLLSEIKAKHAYTLSKYDWLEVFFHPKGGLQERCWNVFYFINEMGYSWIQSLMNESFDFKQEHYIIYL